MALERRDEDSDHEALLLETGESCGCGARRHAGQRDGDERDDALPDVLQRIQHLRGRTANQSEKETVLAAVHSLKFCALKKCLVCCHCRRARLTVFSEESIPELAWLNRTNLEVEDDEEQECDDDQVDRQSAQHASDLQRNTSRLDSCN